MSILDRLNRKKNEKVARVVLHKDAVMKSLLFVAGCLISALSYNLFLVPNNFVDGGLNGLSIVINHFFPSVEPRLTILVGNAILLTIMLFTLGFKKSLMSIIGACTSTAFIYLTKDFPALINFSFDSTLFYALAAGVVGGFGEALVYKTGFNTGGNSIVALIIQKYKKMPIGIILRYIAIFVIIGGGISYGYTSIMYSIIITYISTYLVDKMMIGISDSKMFYINTSKESEIKNFILKIIESGVTEIDTLGAYTNRKGKALMCVVPTEKYSLLKSAIKEIDPEAFIVVSDCYEVLGGTKKRRLVSDDD